MQTRFCPMRTPSRRTVGGLHALESLIEGSNSALSLIVAPSSESNMPPKHSFKTKHCRFYAQGTCLKGDACTYIHDPTKQQTPSTTRTNRDLHSWVPQISHHVQLPSSSATSAPYTPPVHVSNYAGAEQTKRYKQKPCFAWKRGACWRGDNCWYSHDLQAQNQILHFDLSNCWRPISPVQNEQGAQELNGGTGRGHREVLIELRRQQPVQDEAARAEAATFATQGRAEAQLRARIEARERAEQEAHARVQAIEREAAIREHAEAAERARVEAATHELARQTRERAEHEARERAEADARELARQARERAEAEARQRQQILEAQERSRQEEQARLDASKTIQRVVLGSIVTYGPGLDIRGFTTGFESCVVHVRGLPADALEREIYELFTQQGIDKARLQLVTNEQLPDGNREARMAMDAEAGYALSVGLDELEFRDRRLSFEVGCYNVPGAMDASDVKGANTVTISWQAATIPASYTVKCYSLDDARQIIQRIHGQVHFGRRLEAYHAVKPFPALSMSLSLFAITISNLPTSITREEVESLAGTTVSWIRVFPAERGVNSDTPVQLVRRTILSSGCRDSSIVSLNQSDTAPDTRQGFVKIQARFSTWDQARDVHDYLEHRNLVNNIQCHAQLVHPFSYTITIPGRQYKAQYPQWNDLSKQARLTTNVRCSLVRADVQNKAVVHVQVSGSDRKAIGLLKMRVESLAAGEKVSGWHYTFDHRAEHKNFVDKVRADSGALMRADRQERQIKLYGSPTAIAQARAMITDELARLAELEHTTHVRPTSVRFFLERGLPELCELLGVENVRFDPITRTLVTSGGDDAQHIIARILKQAAAARTVLPIAGGDVCPICFDTVSAPVRLGCGHAYCSTCLRHFVTSAVDSDKFPLVCMGDEGRCNVPIAIPSIERFLSPNTFAHLLETTFRVHVSQHPLQLKYCRTPGCEQIYRVVPPGGPRPTPVQCPACLSTVCPTCNTDAHEEMTCEENRVHINPAEQERLVDEWVASQGDRVKRCPQCRVPTEKTAGCNHMACKCGVHFCWRCLGVFDAREIYQHMNTAHGGMFAGEPAVNAGPDFAGVNIAEQEDLLRQATARRAAEDGAQNRGGCIIM